RSHLHDRVLMQYADVLEFSRKSLPELFNLASSELSSQFGMKRGHIARFTDRTAPCAEPLPRSVVIPARKAGRAPSRNASLYRSEGSMDSRRSSMIRSPARGTINHSLGQSLADIKIKDNYVFKGIVAAEPAKPRACGCVQPPPITDQVAP